MRTTTWQEAWRAVAPHLSDAELRALARGLKDDPGGLAHGRTVLPDAWRAGAECLPVLAACALGYALWQGRGLKHPPEVSAALSVLRHGTDPTGVGPAHALMGWWDSATTAEGQRGRREALLAEVELSIQQRTTQGG